jgi:hypothetical protein
MASNRSASASAASRASCIVHGGTHTIAALRRCSHSTRIPKRFYQTFLANGSRAARRGATKPAAQEEKERKEGRKVGRKDGRKKERKKETRFTWAAFSAAAFSCASFFRRAASSAAAFFLAAICAVQACATPAHQPGSTQRMRSVTNQNQWGCRPKRRPCSYH